MAGPVMNLLIAVVFGLLARLILAVTSIDSGFADFLMEVLLWFIVFQLMLFFFNLIPLAPLDGWKVMLGLVPPHTAADLQRHEQEAMFALMMLIFIGFFIPGLSLIGAIISPPIRFVFGVLTGL
jgi:Zn-dependent protease